MKFIEYVKQRKELKRQLNFVLWKIDSNNKNKKWYENKRDELILSIKQLDDNYKN